MIDCGFKTQRECAATIGGLDLDGVLVSHTHGDHISYSSLRVLGQRGAAVHCHESILEDVRDKQMDTGPAPRFRGFAEEGFTVGDFEIRGVSLPHDPWTPNFGFVLHCGTGSDRRKVVVCTDFHDYRGIVDHFADADFVFVEANHDPDLLRMNWNPSSLFHLSNPKTAELLCTASGRGDFAPRRVVLGHLSAERNTETLAVDTIVDAYQRAGRSIGFELDIAPKYEPSRTFLIE